MDYDTTRFSQLLSHLEPHLPVSDEYDENYGQKQGVWWKSQRDHMTDWFDKQNSTGKGHYTRSIPNKSARITYNRLKCPGALLWIAEALGEDKDTLEEAASTAAAEPNVRKRSDIVRKFIPWDRIFELSSNKI